jgi:hypothetical protein
MHSGDFPMSNRTEVLSSYEENRIGFPVSDLEKPYPNILTESNNLPIKILGTQYASIIEPYLQEIQNQLNDPTKVLIRQIWEGKAVRSTLKNNDVVAPIVSFFENLFDRKAKKVLVNRGYPSTVPSYENLFDCDENNYWLSQYWHIDNMPHTSFSLGVYLNDVDIGGGQFEYLRDPHYHYYNPFSAGKTLSRISGLNLDSEEIVPITGEKFTAFIFVPNFVHRGTFPRTTTRDFLRIRFD